jgi:gamma-glutamyltranspeptidase / glutathione hydrolase
LSLKQPSQGGYQPVDQVMSSESVIHRPVVMGIHGMVATGHPLASAAALDVLKDGGNAVDAALCASGVLSVVKSYHCGLGGDVFGILYSARQRRVLVLNGSGRSPRLLRRETYSGSIPHRGILAATTPGAVGAWFEAASKLGSRPISDLLKPAIEYADNGFPVFPHLAKVIHASHRALGADPAWAAIFLPDRKAPDVGDLLVQKDLGATLREIASGGREAFYAGDIASSVVKKSDDCGGCFSRQDFAEHQSRWEEPLCATYRGYEVLVPPPNSYGLLLLLQLKILAYHDLAALGHNTPECAALQVRAKEEAWRAGQTWLADPAQYRSEDITRFLSAFPGDKESHAVAGGLPEHGNSTTYIATADKFGNWASLIQSVHQSFGCGVVVDGTGIVLNNRMSGFNLMPNHPNELAPAKLPAHTLSPALVLRDDKPVIAIGTPGGLGQTQFLTQTICNLVDFGMNLQQAVEAPRWQSERTGCVELESRIPSNVCKRLISEGYKVKVGGPWEFAFGGVEAIRLHDNGKVFMAAADPRRDGYAIGY